MDFQDDLCSDLKGFLGAYEAGRRRNLPELALGHNSTSRHYYASQLLPGHCGTVLSQASGSVGSAESSLTFMSSCFDDPQDNQSSWSSSTPAPSRNGPAAHHRIRPPMAVASLLHCEFVKHHNCGVVFDVGNVGDWISHACGHLGNRFPKTSQCWFCKALFKAATDEETSREASFHNRMHHIADHFRRQGLSYAQMRPDFYFLDHILSIGLISPETHKRASLVGEGPRIPGSGSSQRPQRSSTSRGNVDVVVNNSYSRRRAR